MVKLLHPSHYTSICVYDLVNVWIVIQKNIFSTIEYITNLSNQHPRQESYSTMRYKRTSYKKSQWQPRKIIFLKHQNDHNSEISMIHSTQKLNKYFNSVFESKKTSINQSFPRNSRHQLSDGPT